MNKIFQDDNGNFSTGRVLALLLFFVVTTVWIITKIKGQDLSNNDMTLIQWGWITSIGGKAVQKFAEAKK